MDYAAFFCSFAPLSAPLTLFLMTQDIDERVRRSQAISLFLWTSLLMGLCGIVLRFFFSPHASDYILLLNDGYNCKLKWQNLRRGTGYDTNRITSWLFSFKKSRPRRLAHNCNEILFHATVSMTQRVGLAALFCTSLRRGEPVGNSLVRCTRWFN